MLVWFDRNTRERVYINPQFIAAVLPRHRSDGGGSVIVLAGENPARVRVQQTPLEVKEKLDKWNY